MGFVEPHRRDDGMLSLRINSEPFDRDKGSTFDVTLPRCGWINLEMHNT